MGMENFKPKPKKETEQGFISEVMKEKIASIEARQNHEKFMKEKSEEIIAKNEKTAHLTSGIGNFLTASLFPAMSAIGLGLSANGIDYPGYELAGIGAAASLMFIGPISEGYKKSIEKIKTYLDK